MTLAVAHEFVSGCINGLAYIGEALETFFERVLAAGRSEPQSAEATPALAGEYVLDFFRRLGAVLGALHCRLSRAPGAAFAPQPISKLYVRSVYQSLRNLPRQAVQAQARNRSAATLPQKVLLQRFARIRELETGGLRLRIHGDFELENILFRGKDILVVDFDGDVRLSLGERRLRRSALRDVASMLVSLRLIAAQALRGWQAGHSAEKTLLEPWLQLWLKGCENTFLQSYAESCAGLQLLPQGPSRLAMLEIFMLERLLRKLTYDLKDGQGQAGDVHEALEALLAAAPPAPTLPEA